MLDSYNFKSILKNELNYFIKYKRSLGLKYQKEISRLKYIDNILYELKLKSKIITKETFNKLVERNNMQEKIMQGNMVLQKIFVNILYQMNIKIFIMKIRSSILLIIINL